MKKIEQGEAETMSQDIKEANLRQLQELFPEAFSEGRLDTKLLEEMLPGGAIDEREEKYGLNWHGKRRARQLALTPSTGTLRPCPDESVAWETTQNLMIEGDNLEVLKLLQKSYAGKVKLIYIDPPYNTGNDFVYPDDFHDNITNYLMLTGQVDSDGRKISSNTEASGRFHTDWLNMIYPRIKLAHPLLGRDGIMLISIDDHEVHNLRSICDAIFGDENYCGTFVWEKKKKPSFLSANMGTVTEYIVAYAKSRADSPAFVAGAVEDGKKYPFNNAGNAPAELFFPIGSVTFTCEDQRVPAQDMSEKNIITRLLDDVVILNGKNANPFRLFGEWRYSQSKLNEFVSLGAEIVISKVPFRPNYINRSGDAKKTANLLSHRVNGVPTNEDATEEMRKLFGNDVMSYPKPVGLLKYLLRATTKGDDLILDFFAGSGTTAAAAWELNAEDDGRRRTILVQLPEPIEKDDPDSKPAANFLTSINKAMNIAELTKERLRREGGRLKENNPLFKGDLGFRVYSLASSCFKPWTTASNQIAQNVELFVDNILPGRNNDDLLTEVMLKLGIELTSPGEGRLIGNMNVQALGNGSVIACFAPSIEESDVERLALGIIAFRDDLQPVGETICIFRDDAFKNDVVKTNLSLILQQYGIASVRSL
ncbi:MAG: site-specific DNA-methyltransferase [Pirellulaceae bacterium]|jgi:adenine-specific DNA-methyltransferase